MDTNTKVHVIPDPQKTDLRAEANRVAFALKEEHEKFQRTANTLLREMNMGLKEAEAHIKKGEAELNASNGPLADQLGDAVVKFLVGEE